MHRAPASAKTGPYRGNAQWHCAQTPGSSDDEICPGRILWRAQTGTEDHWKSSPTHGLPRSTALVWRMAGANWTRWPTAWLWCRLQQTSKIRASKEKSQCNRTPPSATDTGQTWTSCAILPGSSVHLVPTVRRVGGWLIHRAWSTCAIPSTWSCTRPSWNRSCPASYSPRPYGLSPQNQKRQSAWPKRSPSRNLETGWDRDYVASSAAGVQSCSLWPRTVGMEGRHTHSTVQTQRKSQPCFIIQKHFSLRHHRKDLSRLAS